MGRNRKPRFDWRQCKTAQEFGDALAQLMSAGSMSEADQRAATVLAKVRGWMPTADEHRKSTEPNKRIGVTDAAAPVAAARPEEEKSAADGFWYWRESITKDEWDGLHWATKPPEKPWQGPLTAEEMVKQMNTLVELGKICEWNGEPWHFCALSVMTPKGIEGAIWCEYPCTLAELEKVNSRPPRKFDRRFV